MLLTLTLAMLGIFGSALSRLIADDVRAWVPRLVVLVIARAVQNLPVDKRERYHEEWLSNVSELPGDLSKLLYSLGLLPASWSMRRIAGRATQGTAALSDRITGSFDVLGAAILLFLASPIFLLVAVMNVGSCGPIFFAHRRIGVGGESFYCLKFRTMVVDADSVLKEALAKDPTLAAEWDASQKLSHDPRFTRIGQMLRKTGLVELPQLINVLLRQMSLVGPRPIVESEVRFYGDDIAHYYNTRPGMTGLWQVSGRSNTSYTRRVQLDVWYAKNRSIRLYFAILLSTLSEFLGRHK
jgi:exopolysaccharide production protein ExoY